MPTSTVTIRIRIAVGDDIAIGQGKADLLEAISRSGSISAAARELGLSYRKGCLLYTSPSPRDRTRSRMPSSA